jgi:hypothetical protein
VLPQFEAISACCVYIVDLERQQLKLSYVDERKKAWTFTLCSWNAVLWDLSALWSLDTRLSNCREKAKLHQVQSVLRTTTQFPTRVWMQFGVPKYQIRENGA